jgi:hypothetical protein
MRIKLVKIPLATDVYATAKEEAAKAGFTCVGTKIRFDVERYYRRIAQRRRQTQQKNPNERSQ